MEAELPQGEIYPERKKMHTHSSLSYALSSSPANHDGQNLLAAFQTEKGEQTLLCKYCNKPLMVHGLVQTHYLSASIHDSRAYCDVMQIEMEELLGNGNRFGAKLSQAVVQRWVSICSSTARAKRA